MKIISSSFKKGYAKVQIENLDDLWYLNGVIDLGDIVSGQTERKIQVGGDEERSKKVTKRWVFMKIKVDKVEFHKYSNILRASGTIVEGPEDVPRGSHHTFNLEENKTITIEKPEWLKFQIDRLEEAAKEKTPKTLICILDREEAYFALMKKFGYELLTGIRGDVQKKDVDKSKIGNFYADVIKMISEYEKRYNFDSIIVASPAFWKEDLIKELKEESLRKKIVLATCSSVDEGAINEVLKRQEVQNVLKRDRVTKEVNLVEELLKEVSKSGLGIYGLKEVENAANTGAVKTLIITDKYMQESRQSNTYSKIENLMKSVEKSNGNVRIISSDHDGGKRLDGLGSIGALLRFKLAY